MAWLNINTVKPADSSVSPEESPIFTTRQNCPKFQSGFANLMVAFSLRKCLKYKNTVSICEIPVATPAPPMPQWNTMTNR